MAFGLPKSELTYADYLKIPELTSLQHLLSEPPKHDEMLFIVIHQVYELWFKLLLHEIDGVAEALSKNNADDAIHLLHRCVEIERILVHQVDVLETMRPIDFLTFRNQLMPASGLQSAQFREIEFVSGLKNPAVLKRYETNSEEHTRLNKRLEAPSILETFYELLSRRGIDMKKSKPMDALKKIYQNPHQYPDLLEICELLLDYDEMFSRWRLIHVQMVERMIGTKTGTGGTEGVSYLKTTLNQKFFPELWELRSNLA